MGEISEAAQVSRGISASARAPSTAKLQKVSARSTEGEAYELGNFPVSVCSLIKSRGKISLRIPREFYQRKPHGPRFVTTVGTLFDYNLGSTQILGNEDLKNTGKKFLSPHLLTFRIAPPKFGNAEECAHSPTLKG